MNSESKNLFNISQTCCTTSAVWQVQVQVPLLLLYKPQASSLKAMTINCSFEMFSQISSVRDVLVVRPLYCSPARV